MAVLDFIEATAVGIQDEHRSFQMMLKMLFAEHLDATDSTSPKVQREFLQELNKLTSEAIGRHKLGLGLAGAVGETIAYAISASECNVNEESFALIKDLARQGLDNAYLSLRDTLQSDKTVVMNANKKLQLQAAMKSAAGIDIKIAMNMVKNGALNSLHFGKRDRSGALWNTTILSKTTVRSLLVSVYCETLLMALLSNGITQASFTNDAGDKQVFNILGEDGEEYAAIQARYFHPNASRLVQLP